MNELQPAIDLIKRFEGLRLKAYQDSVGIWTIGYGTTHPNGQPVSPDQTCTIDEAVTWLAADVEKCASAIKSVMKVPLTGNEVSALISLSYNIGIGALERSMLVRELNAGAPKAEAAWQFLAWDRADGLVLPGLLARRQAERAVFLS
jgi:lysozyme